MQILRKVYKTIPLLCFLLIPLSVISSCTKWVSFYSEVDNPKYNSTIRGTIDKPEGDGPFPAAILMHGCVGLSPNTSSSLKRHSSYLVSHGFVTLILDSFSSRAIGGIKLCKRGLQAVASFRQYDAFHALQFLQTQAFVDKDNIFLMGQSNGAAAAMLAAFGADEYVFPQKPKFQGIVAYYGWCGYLSSLLPVEIVSPLLVLTGEKDDWTPPRWCVDAKSNVVGADYNVIVYENAYHSFDLPIEVQSFANHTIGRNAAATKDSRKQMLDWFLTHMQ